MLPCHRSAVLCIVAWRIATGYGLCRPSRTSNTAVLRLHTRDERPRHFVRLRPCGGAPCFRTVLPCARLRHNVSHATGRDNRHIPSCLPPLLSTAPLSCAAASISASIDTTLPCCSHILSLPLLRKWAPGPSALCGPNDVLTTSVTAPKSCNVHGP